MQEIPLSEIYGLSEEQSGAFGLLGIKKALVSCCCFAVTMEAKEIHLNTQGTVHGGILYTLCDQAIGTFLVYQQTKGVTMNGNIHYYRPAYEGDILTATACERKKGKKTGIYLAELKNQKDELIADAMFTVVYLD